MPPGKIHKSSSLTTWSGCCASRGPRSNDAGTKARSPFQNWLPSIAARDGHVAPCWRTSRRHRRQSGLRAAGRGHGRHGDDTQPDQGGPGSGCLPTRGRPPLCRRRRGQQPREPATPREALSPVGGHARDQSVAGHRARHFQSRRAPGAARHAAERRAAVHARDAAAADVPGPIAVTKSRRGSTDSAGAAGTPSSARRFGSK